MWRIALPQIRLALAASWAALALLQAMVIFLLLENLGAAVSLREIR
jgi:hypothetical protein